MNCTACLAGGARREAEGQGQHVPWSCAELLTWELWLFGIAARSPKAGDRGERLQEQLGAGAVPEGLLRSHSQHLLTGCVENSGVRVRPAALICSIVLLQLQRATSCHGGGLLPRTQKHLWLETGEEKEQTGGDLNHLLRQTAVTACPGRPGRSDVCAHVAQLVLC